VAYVINTHFHPDHILGNAAFLASKPVFIAHINLPRGLMARKIDYLASAKESLGPAFAGTDIVLPQHLVRTVEQIDLGHRQLTLTAYPPAHTDAEYRCRPDRSRWQDGHTFHGRSAVLPTHSRGRWFDPRLAQGDRSIAASPG
jgi:hypothetical protein